MQVLQEITKWEESTPNHKYWVNNAGKLVAFENSFGYTKFNRPLRFDKARRKFTILETIEEALPKNARKVEGSNGKIYTVTEDKCSCPGFRFRGTCKHMKD